MAKDKVRVKPEIGYSYEKENKARVRKSDLNFW